RRIEGGIEERIAAARPGFRFPDDLTRPDKRDAGRSEPVERIRQAFDALFRDNRLRGVTRRPTSEQRDDPGASALIFVAIPHRAERQVTAERARQADRTPEPPRELQEGFRRASVPQPRDR